MMSKTKCKFWDMRVWMWGVVPFFLLACNEEDLPVEEPEGPIERTVLMYVVADNNLSSFAEDDLEEVRLGMANVPATTALFVYMDKAYGNPQLLKFRNVNGDVREEVVKEYEDRNSTGVEETQEVFQDVFENPAYQAESYALIYWSHCDGWIPYPLPSSRWIGQDAGNGDNRMNLSDFKEIMSQAPHFDFIMFDACFMQSIEVAYELRDYANYYIASPTETPGPGAPYDAVLPYIAQEGASAALADAYFNVYDDLYAAGAGISNTNWTGGASICVLNMAELGALAGLTAQFLPEEADTQSLVEEIFNYDRRSHSDSHYVGYYDWAQMMQTLLDEEDYTAWKEAFDSAVVYWNTTPMNYSSSAGMFSMEGTHGVTHYIPQSVTSARAEAYRSLEWYEAAGLSKLGW